MTSSLPGVDDERSLRDVFSRFPSGVVSVCARIGGQHIGIAMSTFVPVSLHPPLVAVCVANSSTTWPTLRTAPRIGISILGKDQATVARSLAMRSADRFAGLSTTIVDSGAVFIDGSSTWLDTTVENEISAGDHLIITLKINAVTVHEVDTPLVFHHSTFHALA